MTATWTAPATITDGDLVDATWLNTNIRDNLEYLFNGHPVNQWTGGAVNGASITSTSTSWVDVSANFSKTITVTSGARVLVMVLGQFSETVASKEAWVKLYVDGVAHTPLAYLFYNVVSVTGAVVLTGLAPGAHTVAVKWACAAGASVSLLQQFPCASFVVMEI